MTSTAQTFDPVAKTMHWLVAFAVLFMLVLGGVMVDAGDFSPELRRALFTTHKTIGILIFFATLFRLYWRRKNPPPPLPLHLMPRWQIIAARFVHKALYVLTLVIPLAGWVLVSTGPYGIALFGVIPFPILPLAELEQADTLREIMSETHETLASFLAVLIVLHIGGTFMHHFVDRDDVLMRIAPEWSHKILNRIRGL